MSDQFDPPAPEVPRDRWGRPLVVPPDGGKPVGYTRCTRFVDALDDKYNLMRWCERQVAIGLSDRSDLRLAVAAHRDDKKKLDEITDKAKEAAKATAAATTGTAVHSLTERVDRGEPLPTLEEEAARDLDAYARATSVLTPISIEEFVVVDDYKVGGTFDRIVEYDGVRYIADVKTGGIDYGAMKIAMQLAVYSRGTPYSFRDNARHQRDYQVDQDWAIVIHLPAGKGTCELRWVNIGLGWDAVQTAAEVWGWRKYKDWYAEFDATVPKPDWKTMVAEATTVDHLRDVWAAADLIGEYSPELHELCVARKKEIES